jgi:arsenate reductase
MTLRLYGIPNCDTVKKARLWLGDHAIAYHFHDYKREGISAETLQRWCAAKGWQTVLNRNGTTFRALPDADKQDLTDARAIALMLAQPTMIKRPALEGKTAGAGEALLFGFSPAAYQQALKTTP